MTAASDIDKNEDLAVALRTRIRAAEADMTTARAGLEQFFNGLDPQTHEALQHYIELYDERARLAAAA